MRLQLNEFQLHFLIHRSDIHLRTSTKFRHKRDSSSISFLKFLKMMFQSFLTSFFKIRSFDDVHLIVFEIQLIFY
jgi:hypothetical protein